MLITEAMKSKSYQDAQTAFVDGSVQNKDTDSLRLYLLAITMNATGDDAIQSRDIVQAISLNNMIMQRHMDSLDRRNTITQWWVIILAALTLLATIVSIFR